MKNEITTEYLESLTQLGIPFNYRGVTQFLPVDDSSFKVNCLIKTEKWIERSFIVDLKGKEIFPIPGYERERIQSIKQMEEEIRFKTMCQFEEIICDKTIPSKLEIDNLILNFSKTFKQIKEWLEGEEFRNCLKPRVKFEKAESAVLQKILDKINEKQFASVHEKQRFWEDVLILHQDYFPDENCSLIEKIIQSYERGEQISF